MNQAVESIGAPKATGPFSQAIVSGNIVFVGGQIYLTPEGNLLEGNLEDQVRQIMSNLENVLKEAGCDFKNVVKTTIYVTDMGNYGKINEIYGSYFEAPYPAREVVCVKELPLGAVVEISMVAMKG
ncbi:Rid family detoxifying hydrolase [Candidatus Dojkabacteria bacterium]|uniref:Rid family detoxifying hydrolase n=1 Tax=Candidatus Dojkabacteria bacterium TaxID=2099670 RepID=A0A955L3G3_9BACT|nr:Rid family detoxifying hydrolase [Candidatus Dojkabacteria bacterium]